MWYRTLCKTSKPAETCEPDKDTGVIAGSSAQKQAENGEQQEAQKDEQQEADNGEQQEDTAVLGENDEQEQETELAKNWEECRSIEDLGIQNSIPGMKKVNRI